MARATRRHGPSAVQRLSEMLNREVLKAVIRKKYWISQARFGTYARGGLVRMAPVVEKRDGYPAAGIIPRE